MIRSELKNEDLQLKILNNKIINIDEQIRLADAEWSFITSSKNIEYLNNKFLKLKTIPIRDISSITLTKIILTETFDKSQTIIKEIN